MSEAAQRKEKQKWAVEKRKLDNAGRLRGIYFINPADEELKERRKIHEESWKVRCQQQCLAKSEEERKYRETCRTSEARKTKYACIVEADESTRRRLEGTLHQDHEDHLAGKGINSLNHYNFGAQVYSYA